ncbi:MAG: hypothetical protein D6679_07260 [Candidatus Hydrogenedentota bacterium]|nr:MAG: hypothetical protein D6679_07260 [Candidatus Hydrogenedentota bacterium]
MPPAMREGNRTGVIITGVYTFFLLFLGEWYSFGAKTSTFSLPLLFFYVFSGAVVGVITLVIRNECLRTAFLAGCVTFLLGTVSLYRLTGMPPFSRGGLESYSAVFGVAMVIAFFIFSGNRFLKRRFHQDVSILIGTAFIPVLPSFVNNIQEALMMRAGNPSFLLEPSTALWILAPFGVTILLCGIACRLGDVVPATACILFVFLLVLLFRFDGAAEVFPRAASDSAPNVLLVVADSLRADHTEIEGTCFRNTTPTLLHLADSALVFRRCLAASPVSEISIPSILTGLLPPEHGIIEPGSRLREPASSLPGHFRRMGYRTGYLLWERRYRIAGLAETVFDKRMNAPPVRSFLGAASDQWALGYLFAAMTGNIFSPHFLSSGETDRLLLEQILSFVREDSERPFFLYFHDLRLHIPIIAYPESGPVWSRPLDHNSYWDFWEVWTEAVHGRRSPKTGHVLKDFRDRYDDAVLSFDIFLRKLLDGLHHSGNRRRTLVIVTADHGEPLGDEGVICRSVDQPELGAVWVPLVVYDPVLKERRDIYQPVTSADIAAIIMNRLYNTPLPSHNAVAGGIPPALYGGDGRTFIRRTQNGFRITGWGTARGETGSIAVIRHALGEYSRKFSSL